ncbi:Mov34/MPN/PAD-1 family protein [Novosphingobium lentum]|uniref:Mov34/MPN/PAD-1 family protein n=1 Tax=Novosphingobium lentum TaxID=145287 RepID=UPI000836366A|nr:M67 family metallopeptidase [Novosphingobium lentum]
MTRLDATGIALAGDVFERLLAEAQRAAPLECCGLLLAQAADPGRVTALVPTANVSATPHESFEIDPAALLGAHRAARSGGPVLAGFYHSHPNGRRDPSPCDATMASGDGRVWAIIAGGRVGCWRDTAHGFEPLFYTIVDN